MILLPSYFTVVVLLPSWYILVKMFRYHSHGSTDTIVLWQKLICTVPWCNNLQPLSVCPGTVSWYYHRMKASYYYHGVLVVYDTMIYWCGVAHYGTVYHGVGHHGSVPWYRTWRRTPWYTTMVSHSMTVYHGVPRHGTLYHGVLYHIILWFTVSWCFVLAALQLWYRIPW